MAAAGEAGAHDWYPRECCSEKDCFAMEPGEYEIEPDGIRIIATGELIAHEKARRGAPDGRFHRCTMLGRRDGRTLATGAGPCLWAPEAGL